MGRGPGIRLHLGVTGAGLRPANRLGAASVVLVVLVLAAGCGSDGAPDFDLETIAAMVPALLVPGHPEVVDGVDCGDPDPYRLGPVACTAVLSGVEIPVLVHRPAIDGRIRVESPVEVVGAADVAAEAAVRLESDLGLVNVVVCMPAVRVAREGQAFACTATDPRGRDHVLVATLVGRDGSFRLDLDLP